MKTNDDIVLFFVVYFIVIFAQILYILYKNKKKVKNILNKFFYSK